MKRAGVCVLWVACVLTAISALAQQQTIPDRDARLHVGETASVKGMVANVYTSAKGNTFLNFGNRYPNQTFSAVVFADHSATFHNLHSLEGKEVLVTGKIQLYRGRPEIILNSPAQLKQLQ